MNAINSLFFSGFYFSLNQDPNKVCKLQLIDSSLKSVKFHIHPFFPPCDLSAKGIELFVI